MEPGTCNLLSDVLWRRGHWLAAPLLGLVLLASQAAEAQIAFRSAQSESARAPAFRAAASSNSSIGFVAAGAQVASDTAGSITPAIPAGTVANDFAVLIIAGRPTDLTDPGTPGGWTLRSSSVVEVGANDLKILTYYRVLAGGDANPSITLPASWVGTAAGMSGQIAVWRGVDTTTPFDVADVTGTLTPANGFWTPPSITTVTNGAWVVSAVALSDDSELEREPAQGFIGRKTGSNFTTLGGDHATGLADKLQATAGAATMLQWVQVTNAPDLWAGITFAFRPVTTAIAIAVPAGTIQNDVMIASVGVQPSSATITAPAGWTLVRRIDNGSATTNSLAVYRRVAGAAEPASYSWTLSGATFAVGGIQSFSGVDTITPIDIDSTGQATPSATTHATQDVTTTMANTMVVTSHTYASSRTWSPVPSGMTESFDRPSGADSLTGQSIVGHHVLQAATGATGTKTATAAGDADVGNAHILALRPATPALTINKPTGTVANDVMIASIGVQPSTTTITPPAGWTLVRRMDNATGNTNSLAIYSKVDGGAEPASYTWTLSNFTHAVGGIQSFSGVDTTTPINVENGQTTASALTHSTPDVTTTVADTMLVTSHTFASSRTWTPPAGPPAMNEAFDAATLPVNNASGQSMEGNWLAQAAIGATGIKTATVGGNADVGNTHILALKPPAGVPTPGSFNAFETSTPAAAITGVIRTKIAGTAFSLDVVAIASGAQLSTFNDNVKVELLANTGTPGSGYGSDNCPTANSVIQTIASASITGGRSAVSFSAVADVFRDVRVRISFPTTSPTVTSCSTDSFAIRPNTLASFAVTDSNATTAGTTRALNLLTFAATTPTHNARRPFSVRATALNGAAAVTTNYVGAPTATLTACVGAACTASFGTFTLGAAFALGQLTSDAATYSEVGSFALQLVDSTFASVDASDGSTTTERNITSAVINVGRFVPDHFAVSLNTPVFGTACGAGGFTYIGQAFNYATQPQITVTAQDFNNNTTALYAGAWFRISSASLTGKSYTAATGTLDTSGITGTDPVIVVGGSGMGTLTFSSGTGVFFTRTTPVAPFNAEISLAINVIDADGVILASNPARFGTATAGGGIDFPSGKQMRFGRLTLRNANGSQLVPLLIRMETQYWNGTSFITNTDDNCTTFAGANIEMSNPTGGLSPVSACVTSVNNPITFSSGRGTMVLSKPTGSPAATGSVDLMVRLDSGSFGLNSCVAGVSPPPQTTTGANRPYLQTGSAFSQNPTGRATFGTYPGSEEVIFIRENF